MVAGEALRLCFFSKVSEPTGSALSIYSSIRFFNISTCLCVRSCIISTNIAWLLTLVKPHFYCVKLCSIMRRRRRPILLLLFSFLLFACLAYLILNFDPAYKLTIYNLQLTILPIFLALVFLSTLSLSSYLLNNSRRGLFISLFITSYLLLRFFHLTHLFFLILLIALFFVLELLFSNRK